MSGNILEVESLRVRRGGVPVLDVESLAVRKGEFLSIIGPNGAGKSTLLLSLAGLVRRERGRILFHDRPVENGADLLSYRRRLAMVFQEPLLFDSTVYGNVASGLKIRGWSRARIRPAVEETLALFGISHLAARSARRISGGEAQRTSLARAFATDPEMIFLDEPFASLDPPARESIIEDLGNAMALRRTTAIMATHDRMDALRLSNRMAVMQGGRIVQAGIPDEVMNHPVNEMVAAFVGVENMLEGQVAADGAGVVEVGMGRHSIATAGAFAPGDRVTCLIRPEQITIFPGDRVPESSARNAIPGRILKVQPRGPIFQVLIDCGHPLTAHVTRQSVEDLHLEPGLPIVASFKATAVHVIRRAGTIAG